MNKYIIALIVTVLLAVAIFQMIINVNLSKGVVITNAKVEILIAQMDSVREGTLPFFVDTTALYIDTVNFRIIFKR